MGIMVYSLIRVMQDFVHQPQHTPKGFGVFVWGEDLPKPKIVVPTIINIEILQSTIEVLRMWDSGMQRIQGFGSNQG